MKTNAMNGIFAGKAMGVKSRIINEEELQEEILHKEEQNKKKDVLFKKSSNFDINKILNIKHNNFNVHNFLNNSHIQGDKMKNNYFEKNKNINYKDKLKQFGISTPNIKTNNYNDKLKQFGISTPSLKTNKYNDKLKGNNFNDKLKQFGINTPNIKTNKYNDKLKQFGISTPSLKTNKYNDKLKGNNFNDKLKQFGINIPSLKTNNYNDKLKQFGIIKTKKSNNINKFLGNNFMNSIKSIQHKTTVKGIKNTENFGWNRIKQQKGLNPLGDYDGDKLINMLDCNPRNPKKKGPIHNDEGQLFTPDENNVINIESSEPENIYFDNMETVNNNMKNVTPENDVQAEFQDVIEPTEQIVEPTEENNDTIIDLNEVTENIKEKIGQGFGTATEKVGQGISTVKDYIGNKYNEYKENKLVRDEEKKEELKEQKKWETEIKRKAQEEAIKNYYKKDIENKVNINKGKKQPIRQKVLDKVDRIDKFGRNSLKETSAGFSKAAESFLPGKEAIKVGQLIGNFNTGQGVYMMAKSIGSRPYSNTIKEFTGTQYAPQPFSTKVAFTVGKTGLEPRESYPLKVDYYISGGKNREEILNKEKSIYEKLKEQARDRRELNELSQSFSQPMMESSQPMMESSQPMMESSQPMMESSQPLTPSISQPITRQPVMQQPTQEGKVYSEKSKRWVKYTRKPYSKHSQQEQY